MKIARGAMSTPATAAMKAPIVQLTLDTARVGMPMRPATARSWAQERVARPSRVARRNNASPAMRTRPETRMAICWLAATVPPRETPPVNSSGAFFGSNPKSARVTPCMKTYRPSVTMTLVMNGASARRRSTTNSARVPRRLTTTTVTRAAQPTGQSCVVVSHAYR